MGVAVRRYTDMLIIIITFPTPLALAHRLQTAVDESYIVYELLPLSSLNEFYIDHERLPFGALDYYYIAYERFPLLC